MTPNQLKNLATKYCVEDLKESLTLGTALSNVISRIELAPDYIPEPTKTFLKKAKLNGLLKYACNQISFEEFTKIARSEQEKRKIEAEKYRKIQAKQAEINAERQRKQQQARKLLRKYDLNLHDVKFSDLSKLQEIIKTVENNKRLGQEELAWLMVSPREYYSNYYTEKLRVKYHRIEAEYYLTKYKKSKNPWDVINASSHFRKCNCAKKADAVLRDINVSQFKAQKAKSAFNTTYGGVKRDLRLYDEAITLGNSAHKLTPKDFRPCTLIGAVNMEMGNFNEGQSWYKMAVERGASEKSVDDDLRSIFNRSDKAKRKNLAMFLLEKEPKRYRWVKKYLK